MTAFLSLLLAVTLLPPESAAPKAAASSATARAAFIREADEGMRASAKKADDKPKEVRIRSKTSDFDRLEGVALFEGHAVAEYSTDFTLVADRIFAFFAASNRLQRIVASGHVAITNETRVGGAAMATFTKDVSVVNLYGDKDNPAWINDKPNRVAGTRIRFKIDSEQVEVIRPIFDVEGGGKVEKLVK